MSKRNAFSCIEGSAALEMVDSPSFETNVVQVNFGTHHEGLDSLVPLCSSTNRTSDHRLSCDIGMRRPAFRVKTMSLKKLSKEEKDIVVHSLGFSQLIDNLEYGSAGEEGDRRVVSTLECWAVSFIFFLLLLLSSFVANS